MPERKVIITCAVTGSIHTPSMSPHLPVTAEEIAEAAIGAAEAGAAIVHLHARNPVDGRPDQSPEAFEPFLREIKRRSNVVVNLTTGGSPFMSVEERVRPAAVWKPEVASLNMGSMNFGLFPMLSRFKEFKHGWEPEMLENSRDLVFRNSFKDIAYALRTLNETGARYEFECYDTSHLYNLHHFWQEGLVRGPLFIQTVFGLLGGIGAEWVWRTRCGRTRAGWPNRTRCRCARHAPSSKGWAWRSPPPRKPGKSCSSRAPTRSPSESDFSRA
jgi:uncharacterized protein (DUF849 family)